MGNELMCKEWKRSLSKGQSDRDVDLCVGVEVIKDPECQVFCLQGKTGKISHQLTTQDLVNNVKEGYSPQSNPKTLKM